MICYFLLSFQLVSYDEGNTKGKTINKKANLFSGSVKGISCLNLVGLPVFEDTCLGVKNGHNLWSKCTSAVACTYTVFGQSSCFDDINGLFCMYKPTSQLRNLQLAKNGQMTHTFIFLLKRHFFFLDRCTPAALVIFFIHYDNIANSWDFVKTIVIHVRSNQPG